MAVENHSASPSFQLDHIYALPASPAAVKTRLRDALASLERLQRKRRNSLIRERRAKKSVGALLDDLREKNVVIETLKDRLRLLSGEGGSCGRRLGSKTAP